MGFQWAIPVIVSILILGSLGLSQDVYAPQGEIAWLNPAEKLGKIAEDGCEDESCWHPFQIPKDLVDPGYEPQVGDRVTYDIGPGNTASNVAKAGIPVEITFLDASGEPIQNGFCRAVDNTSFAVEDEGFTNESGQVTLFVPPDIGGLRVNCTQDDFVFRISIKKISAPASMSQKCSIRCHLIMIFYVKFFITFVRNSFCRVTKFINVFSWNNTFSIRSYAIIHPNTGKPC